jgi:hypothetical protein
MAIVAAYTAGMLSLSRSYALPTFTVAGLSCAHLRLLASSPPARRAVRFDARMALGTVVVSAAYLIALHVFAMKAG